MGDLLYLKANMRLLQRIEPNATRMNIKPCPFCDGPGHLEQDMDGTWFVECVNQGCFVLPLTKPFSCKFEAIRAWNHRGKANEND